MEENITVGKRDNFGITHVYDPRRFQNDRAIVPEYGHRRRITSTSPLSGQLRRRKVEEKFRDSAWKGINKAKTSKARKYIKPRKPPSKGK